MSECPIENWTVVCYFAESAKQNRYIYKTGTALDVNSKEFKQSLKAEQKE